MTREFGEVVTPVLDVTSVLKLGKKQGGGESATPIATISGVVSILAGRRYLIIATTTPITFKLSIDGTGAAVAADIPLPIDIPLVIHTGIFNTFHANGTTGKLILLD